MQPNWVFRVIGTGIFAVSVSVRSALPYHLSAMLVTGAVCSLLIFGRSPLVPQLRGVSGYLPPVLPRHARHLLNVRGPRVKLCKSPARAAARGVEPLSLHLRDAGAYFQ